MVGWLTIVRVKGIVIGVLALIGKEVLDLNYLVKEEFLKSILMLLILLNH
jgi:hypothetical protein